MMNTSERKHGNRLPQWQSDKMRSLIEDRWSEVWSVVVSRERSERVEQHSRNLRHSSY
jgi:hypothetical protein